jgi:hypothetical protein
MMDFSLDPGYTANPRVRYQNPFSEELPDDHAESRRNTIPSPSCNPHSSSNSGSSDVALQHTIPERHGYWESFPSSRVDALDQTPPPSRESSNEQQFSAFIATPYSKPLLNREMAQPLTDVFGNRSIENVERGTSGAMQHSKENFPHSTSPAEGTSHGVECPNWSRLRDMAFIVSVCSAQFLSLACLAQTVAPLSIIGRTFNVEDPAQLSWFTAAYSMTLGTFILPSGLEYRITLLQSH